MIKDTFPVKGDLEITIVDSITGELKLNRKEKNLVVTAGKNLIISRLASNGSAVIDHMAVGTNNTAPNVTDTTLNTELTRVALTSVSPAGNAITYVATFGVGVATGALVEAGLFNSSTAGTMLSRTTFAVVNKGVNDVMTITWTITVG